MRFKATNLDQLQNRIDGVEVVEVIRVTLCRGRGTEENPCRTVYQYWDKAGELLAENDIETKDTDQ